MNKLRVTIENYKALWKEPDFKWLQEFNWFIAARKITRSLFETAALFYITTVLAVFYFYIKSQAIMTFTTETDFTKIQIENIFLMLSNASVAFVFIILVAKLVLLDSDTKKFFVNRYKEGGLHFDERIKGNRYQSTRGFRTLKQALFLILYLAMIQFRETPKIVSMDVVNGMSVVVIILFSLWMLTRLVIYLKFKKWAKEFNKDIQILTTERDFIRLTNQMDSLLILPGKWKGYLEKELAVFTQSVKKTDIKIEGDVVNDINSRLEVVYTIPFTSIRIVYFFQLVEFDTEKEMEEYKLSLLERFQIEKYKEPEIHVLLKKQ
ncbi:hypothetical protein [Carnobacterium maltaromaticum]|uniref:hypothetical protein n=1 Tax=Carnobacterium maltaromaticum TaxID=2751 RepID=UPI0012FAEAB9|nr:hypothetical protein [Carnobacterium maltaromaticum]